MARNILYSSFLSGDDEANYNSDSLSNRTKDTVNPKFVLNKSKKIVVKRPGNNESIPADDNGAKATKSVSDVSDGIKSTNVTGCEKKDAKVSTSFDEAKNINSDLDSLKKREQAYQEARRRIFGTAEPSPNAVTNSDIPLIRSVQHQPRTSRPRPPSNPYNDSNVLLSPGNSNIVAPNQFLPGMSPPYYYVPNPIMYNSFYASPSSENKAVPLPPYNGFPVPRAVHSITPQMHNPPQQYVYPNYPLSNIYGNSNYTPSLLPPQSVNLVSYNAKQPVPEHTMLASSPQYAIPYIPVYANSLMPNAPQPQQTALRDEAQTSSVLSHSLSSDYPNQISDISSTYDANFPPLGA